MNYDINDILSVLSESTSDSLFNIYGFELFTEGEKLDKIKGTIDKVKNSKTVADAKKVGKKVLDSPVGKAAGGLYNGITEAPGEVIGRVAYGSKLSKKNSPEIQKEYQKKLVSLKSNIKTGMTVGVIAAKGLLIGPPDWIITACMTAGLAKDTPVNRETKRKIEVIKNNAKDIVVKVKNLSTKFKNEDATNKEFHREYNNLMREGNNLAREADQIIRNSQKAIPVAESTVIDKFDNYLITENSELVDNACEILTMIIERTDYEKYDLYPLLEHYFDLML